MKKEENIEIYGNDMRCVKVLNTNVLDNVKARNIYPVNVFFRQNFEMMATIELLIFL